MLNSADGFNIDFISCSLEYLLKVIGLGFEIEIYRILTISEARLRHDIFWKQYRGDLGHRKHARFVPGPVNKL